MGVESVVEGIDWGLSTHQLQVNTTGQASLAGSPHRTRNFADFTTAVLCLFVVHKSGAFDSLFSVNVLGALSVVVSCFFRD